MTPTEVFDAFARAWKTRNDDERLALLATACVPDVLSVAPKSQISGVEGLSANIAAFRCAFPSFTISFGILESSGEFFRVAWAMCLESGQPPLIGEDFAWLDEYGRIQLLVSFDGGAAAPSS